MEEELIHIDQTEIWAIVELMGHARTAGRISQPGTYGGLLRVDVPIDDSYRTEFYGNAAIYSIKLVSEEIARAYAQPTRDTYAYNEPIVPREMYENTLREMRQERNDLMHTIDSLRRRLTAVDDMPRLPAAGCSWDEV